MVEETAVSTPVSKPVRRLCTTCCQRSRRPKRVRTRSTASASIGVTMRRGSDSLSRGAGAGAVRRGATDGATVEHAAASTAWAEAFGEREAIVLAVGTDEGMWTGTRARGDRCDGSPGDCDCGRAGSGEMSCTAAPKAHRGRTDCGTRVRLLPLLAGLLKVGTGRPLRR